ncbi:hypothetical protein Patl1_25811 [Pistacia atlantica]|uniref:Uncharacterized protein n=1 Tax=Pistacia atlantica TaxID=434234 RepID=A0ACC1B0K0_9ROSI|nr:hypothetical protein Patl1_25811 [Pistacia atlantica]
MQCSILTIAIVVSFSCSPLSPYPVHILGVAIHTPVHHSHRRHPYSIAELSNINNLMSLV